MLPLPRVKRLLSCDHFTIDGTVIEAWASMKSFKPKDDDTPPPDDPPAGGGRNAEVDFHGERRFNVTHASLSDPDARLYRKGRGRNAKLSYPGHVLMEKRNDLIVEACVTRAGGHAERHAALAMIEGVADRPSKITVGADKAYDTQDFVKDLRAMNATPHVEQNTSRRSAIDGRVIRHAATRRARESAKPIEVAFGRGKEVGRIRRTRFRGLPRVGRSCAFSATAYNLVRLPKLVAA